MSISDARFGLVALCDSILVVLLATLTLSTTAQASPDFSQEMRDHLEMTCKPKCSACHTVDPGVAGTATLPLSISLMSEGLTSGNNASLRDALDALEASGADSDGDEMGDIAELTNGSVSSEGMGGAESIASGARDPNVVGEGEICSFEVKYGCGASQMARATDRRSTTPWILGGLFAIGFGLVRRRFSRLRRSA